MSCEKGDRVVVTGGTGFLGRHLCRVLAERGWKDVTPLSSKDYDLTKPERIAAMFDEQRPRAVIHLAAVVGGIGANRKNPGRFFYDNIVMGVHLIEEARRRNLSKLVLLGTVCSYPKFTPVPFREADLWNGYPEETNAPYGIAKKALLVQAQAYRRQYGLNSIYLIPVNLYGPGDNFDPESSHVIPALIRKFVEAAERGEREVEIWGTGRASREFLYVEDAALGIALALERYDGEQPVNLGAGREITIAELARLIAEECGFKGGLRFNPSYPDGQPRRCLDTSLAEQLFGFRAPTPFREGLRKTIAWFRANRPN